jgi:hypothetical protein
MQLALGPIDENVSFKFGSHNRLRRFRRAVDSCDCIGNFVLTT